MPQIMNTDPLYAGLFCSTIHFMMEVVFCHIENAAIFIHFIKRIEVILHLIAKELRELNCAIAFIRFGRSDLLFAFYHLIGLINPESTFFQIKVRFCKCKQFPTANAGSIEYLKSVI